MSVHNRPVILTHGRRSLLLVVLAVILTWAAWTFGWLPPMERAAGDLLLRASASGDADGAPVVAILIDDETIDLIGPLPWPRDRIAELVKSLRSLHVRGVALDMILADSAQPAADLALREALTGIPVVLAAAFDSDGFWLLPGNALGGASFAAHAYGEVGPDGVVRTISSTKQGNGLSLPALSLAAARMLRPELAGLWDLTLYLEVAEEEIVRRALIRDGAQMGGGVRNRYEHRYRGQGGGGREDLSARRAASILRAAPGGPPCGPQEEAAGIASVNTPAKPRDRPAKTHVLWRHSRRRRPVCPRGRSDGRYRPPPLVRTHARI